MKARNIIFPIWFLWLLPPVIILVVVGNFLLDSLVLVAAYTLAGVPRVTNQGLKTLYKASILKVVLFGFVADIVGVITLLAVTGLPLSIPPSLVSAVNLNPFTNVGAFLTVLGAIILSALCIYALNYFFTFKRIVAEKVTRTKLSATLAVITAPWTFLLPTSWFYPGM
ncbi:hypothetical protein [Kyrpidia sp.]|uniref:hypothetical protein n=1 Tax=Kyrpidia sp. TaxID=2073077 RepID=UPI0025874C70|nr:hypothetical protein [Kyrpidia sp.]MCL6576788.1 hypothetical protein [Kyrpidia sp.]